MSNVSRKSLLAQIDKRWLGAGLAAAGTAVASDQANAAIVHQAPGGGITVPSSFSGTYVNLELGTFGGSSTAGWDINPYGATYLRIYVNATGSGLRGSSPTTFDNLAPGTPICATDTYNTTPGVGGFGLDSNAGFPLNLNSSNNLIGVRFRDAALIDRFGWIRFSLGAANAGVQPRSIVEWAYETDPQACIGAGVVPEPTSIALLAAGAVGLVARRRRQS